MSNRFHPPIFSPNGDVGEALPGALLYFYVNGSSSTLKNTYSDIGLTTPHTNPVEADGDGRFPQIFGIGLYSVKMTDADGNNEWGPYDDITVNSGSNNTLPPLAYTSGNSGFGLSGTSTGASSGDVIQTTHYDSNKTPASGALFQFTGTTTLAKAGDVPNADGYYYDADGKQFVRAGGGWARTAAEIAASVIPIDYLHPPGHESRYSSIGDAYLQLSSNGAPVVSNAGGMILRGEVDASAIAGIYRPEAQLILENTATSGHTIMSMQQFVEDEEAAIEVVCELSTGTKTQQYAQFSRFVDNDNAAATYESVWGLHIVGNAADNNPLNLWSNNSVMLCGGATGTAKWNSPPDENWALTYTYHKSNSGFVAGPNHNYSLQSGFLLEVEGFAQFGTVGSGVMATAVQTGISGGNGFIQAYNVAGSAFLPMAVTGSSVTLGGGHILPDTDNTRNLGSGSFRLKEIFCGNATINTSDKEMKKVVGKLATEAERKWAEAIKSVAYIWKDSFAEKGDDARVHFGVIAQDVMQAGIDSGIENPLGYAFLCRDAKVKKVKKTIKSERHATKPEVTLSWDVDMVDGQAVRVKKEIRKDVLQYEDVPLFNEDGSPVLFEDDQRDEKGTPLPAEPTGEFNDKGKEIYRKPPKVTRQAMYSKPVMEEFDEEVEEEVPVMKGKKPFYQYGIRYTELLMFLAYAS